MSLKTWSLLTAAALAALLVSPATWAVEPQVKVGEKVRDFERSDAAGKSVKLTQVLAGSNAVVVDFWSSRCPVSQKYETRPQKARCGLQRQGRGLPGG